MNTIAGSNISVLHSMLELDKNFLHRIKIFVQILLNCETEMLKKKALI